MTSTKGGGRQLRRPTTNQNQTRPRQESKSGDRRDQTGVRHES
jgi:hypothetical protein